MSLSINTVIFLSKMKKIKKLKIIKKKFIKSSDFCLTIFSIYYSILKRRRETGCSAVGSARGLGPWGREFESLHPDQYERYTV